METMLETTAAVCACWLAAVFCYAAVEKLRDGESFRVAVSEIVPGLPEGAHRAVARVVPAVELALAVGLLLPPTRRWSAAVAAATLVAFTAVLAGALRRGSTASCNCFGSSTAPVGRFDVGRNVLLLAPAVACLASTPAPPTPPLVTAGLLFGATFVTALRFEAVMRGNWLRAGDMP